MKTIKVVKKKLNPKAFVRRSATTDDYAELLTEPCIVRDENDKIIVVYGVIKSDLERLRYAVRHIKMSKNRRTKGLRTQSKIFGYMPREKIRKDWCSSVLLARDQPSEHAIVCNFAKTLGEYYKQYAPEIYSKHLEIVDKVLPEWKIEGSPFTSGIINKNNPLKYHFDKGNFANVYSNMICFRKDVTGGHLAIPEYDIGLDISDKSVVFFDGQKIMHGVTPIHYNTTEAYRFTLVYYSLKRMWQCLPIGDEIDRIRKVKSDLESKRYLRMKGELKDDEWADKIDELKAEESLRKSIR